MKKADIKRVEEVLNARWEIWISFNNTSDYTYYNGLTRMVSEFGYDWIRKDGKHTLIKK